MTIQPGTDIGRYHILEQLGEGGMALVYKAYDTRLETQVAVKVIRVGDITPNALPRILKRFQIEAKKMAQMTHPNIVRVLDYGEYQGAPYLVMPYLPGGTLKNRLGKPMDWREAIRLLLPIANALGYAHKKGLIHRDIKPSNILITEEGQPMLSDFGVAKVLESEETLELTGTGMGVGTPEYMAPEIGMQKEFDQRADIYSLGIVLYELVTGRKPFLAETPVAILLKHASEPLPRPSAFNPNVPQVIEQILFKSLAKKPADRYPDMGSFAKAIGEAAVKNVKVTSDVKKSIFTREKINQQDKIPARRRLETKWVYVLLGTAGVVLLICFSVFFIREFFLSRGEDLDDSFFEKTSTVPEGKIFPPGSWTPAANPTSTALGIPTLTYVESLEKDGYVSINYPVLTEGILFEGDNQIIYITDPEGKKIEKVTEGTFPEWSKDNSMFAFIRDGQLFVADIEKQKLVSVIKLPDGEASFPSFSPDNKRIVFISDGEIYIAEIESGQIERLTNDEFRDGQTTWSPANDKIAFSSDRQGNTAIFLVDANKQDIQRISPIKYDADTPAWIDNGDSILFILYQPPTNYGKLYQMTSYGTNLEIIYSGLKSSLFRESKKISKSSLENIIIYSATDLYTSGYLDYRDKNCAFINLKGEMIYDLSNSQRLVCSNPSWSN